MLHLPLLVEDLALYLAKLEHFLFALIEPLLLARVVYLSQAVLQGASRSIKGCKRAL